MGPRIVPWVTTLPTFHSLLSVLLIRYKLYPSNLHRLTQWNQPTCERETDEIPKRICVFLQEELQSIDPAGMREILKELRLKCIGKTTKSTGIRNNVALLNIISRPKQLLQIDKRKKRKKILVL